MPETSPRPEGEQAYGDPADGDPAYGEPRDGSRAAAPHWTAADVLTALRLPMAIAFVLLPSAGARLVVLALAAATDLLDGWLARHLGGSRLGAFLDPVADKLFMAAAFAVVAVSGRLEWYEILGLLLRDLVATIAFVVTLVTGRAASIPARIGGKAVTVGQVLAIFAFLLHSPLLRPLAWATGAVAVYAIWDYRQVADRERQPLKGAKG